MMWLVTIKGTRGAAEVTISFVMSGYKAEGRGRGLVLAYEQGITRPVITVEVSDDGERLGQPPFVVEDYPMPDWPPR